MKKIIIVGAGPTGLTLGLCLAHHGISFEIIDNRSGPVETSNALGVQPRTLQIWHSLGLLEQAFALGHKIHQACFHDQKGLLGTLKLKQLNTPYPFLLGLSQHHTEEILENALIAKGIEVKRNTACLDIKTFNHQSILTLKNNGHESEYFADYVFACDGSHSVIREKLGVSFIGETLPQRFIMADCQLTTNLNLDAVHAFLSPSGVMAIIPVKNFSRIILEITQCTTLASQHEVRIEDFIPLIKQRSNTNITIDRALWTSPFGVHQKKATNFRQGNVFFLGDSAHIHSPVGGQGMNLGIQDAFNLGWKIAHSIQHQLPKEALTSYHQERNPIAMNILKATTRGTSLISLHHRVPIFLRNQAMKLVLSQDCLQKPIAQTLSQLNQHYPSDSWFQQRLPMITGFKKPLSPGDTFISDTVIVQGKQVSLLSCLDYNQWTLLVFTHHAHGFQLKSVLNKISHLISHRPIKLILISPEPRSLLSLPIALDPTKRLHAAYQATKPCLYLIRPDHKVAYRSKAIRLEELKLIVDHLLKSSAFRDIKAK